MHVSNDVKKLVSLIADALKCIYGRRCVNDNSITTVPPPPHLFQRLRASVIIWQNWPKISELGNVVECKMSGSFAVLSPLDI